ncbi:MAG: carbamate kinase [Chloroflexi bacterium B3_Chlor]|nr:MAG: carbamate kinase [Chloroflexi bacterium B3_Chlor]
MTRTAVIAIGGNSLIKGKQHQTVPDQFATTDETCAHIADIVQQGWRVVITHGNGPQVGFILRRSELASHVLHTVPLDSCGADTQGALGYMIQQLLGNRLRKAGVDVPVATVVTQVIVDRDDPAFQNPTKPIGPFYDEAKARVHEREQGWAIVEDSGRGWRRVVPSPVPREIVELGAIRALLQGGFVVIGVGGGGIPVVRDGNGDLHGVEAVIDKDYASSLLASGIDADLFLISTAVDNVYLNYGQPDQVPLDHVTVDEAKRYLEEGHFAPGSMGPKIEAVIQFLEGGGKEALITSPENLARALRGETGTRMTIR